MSEYQYLPPYISELTVSDNCLNDASLTEVDLSRFIHLRKVLIGENALNHTRVLKMTGLNTLDTLSIGDNSLVAVETLSIGSDSLNSENFTSLPLSRFVNVRNLTIGSNSLTSATSLSLDGLSSLQHVWVGSSSLPHASFSACGMASLVSVELGDDSFNASAAFLLRDASLLSQLLIGHNSFQGWVEESASFLLTDHLSLQTVSVGDGSFPHFTQLTIHSRIHPCSQL